MGDDDRPLTWLGPTKELLRGMPVAVQRKAGFALRAAQEGRKEPNAVPLTGFGGAGVLEIRIAADGDAYRCVYTVRLAHAVYVLHVFQKKSRTGIATPPEEMATVRRRLAEAERLDAERTARQWEGNA